MNLTKFLKHGGSACARTDILSDVIRYSPDPSKPGCDAAYASFRAATTPSFTCDCQGDHAYLGGSGGLRSGTVFTLSNIIGTILVAITAPSLGTWIDHNGGKRVWIALITTAGLCMIGMAVLGPSYVWMVGLVISVITIWASELVTIPRQSYLIDIVDPSATDEDAHEALRTRVSGNRIITSYLSQIIFVVVALVLTVALSLSTTLSSQIITALAGVWYLGHFAYLVPKFPASGYTCSFRAILLFGCLRPAVDRLEDDRCFLSPGPQVPDLPLHHAERLRYHRPVHCRLLLSRAVWPLRLSDAGDLRGYPHLRSVLD